MSLSAHLLESHEDRKPPLPMSNPPHGNTRYPQTHQTSHAGPSNYASTSHNDVNNPNRGPAEPWMANHGMPWWMMQMQSQMQGPQQGRFTSWSEEKIAALQVRLERKLGPEYVTQRPGPGGGPKLSYIEGWKVIGLANEVFGFNGWSSSIVSLTTDFIDVNQDNRVSCHITAIIRITLQDGCYHEDVGGGQCENVKGKGAALDKAKKEAVTDGIKRALKTFGNVLGNCLYDKEYTKEIVKIKVPPAKFNTADLERRPEFAPPPQAQTSNAHAGPSKPSAVPTHMSNQQKPAAPPPIDPFRERAGTPLRSIHDLPNETIVSEYNVTLDENIDPEFFDDSVLAGMDDSMFHGSTTTTNAAQPITRDAGKANSTFKRTESAPAVPVYQHRHRPDMPPAIHEVPGGRSAAEDNQSLREQSEDIGRAPQRPSGDSKSSESTVEAELRPKPRGGFAFPPGTNQPQPLQSAASAARAAAIQLAMSAAQTPQAAPAITPQMNRQRSSSTPFNPPGPAAPNRSESPRIPSGGIDAVIDRANPHFRAQAVKLELDYEKDVQVGFGSARGVKRFGEEQVRDSNMSPSKVGGGGSMMGRNGPRRALGELHVDGDGQVTDVSGGGRAEWEAKRHRLA